MRWNRENENILASCDGGHVKIWDLRKPNTPSEFIAAHASKINGLEWANIDTVITGNNQDIHFHHIITEIYIFIIYSGARLYR